MNKILLIGGIFFMLSVNAQQDPEAQVILDKVADLARSYENIYLQFTYKYYSLVDQSEYIQKGSVMLKDDKYKIAMEGSEIYFDGLNIYNFIPDANEVTISQPESNYDEFFLSHPAKIFVMYRDDFKYRYKGEEEYDNETCLRVDLYPFKLDRDYSAVKLWVSRNNYNIRKIQLIGKSGDRYEVSFTPYKVNQTLKEGYFIFDPSTHKDIYINDTRGVE